MGCQGQTLPPNLSLAFLLAHGVPLCGACPPSTAAAFQQQRVAGNQLCLSVKAFEIKDALIQSQNVIAGL